MFGKALVLLALVIVIISEVSSARFPRQAIKCEDIDIPQAANRVLHYDKARNLLNMQFACFKGYTLIGSSKIVCKDGKWSADAPICIKASDGNMFDYPPKPDKGKEACLDPGLPPTSSRTTVFAKNKLELGSKLKYFCNNGYNLEGKENIVCEKNGQWSGPVPFCNRPGMAFSSITAASASVPQSVLSKPPTTCNEVLSFANGVRTPGVQKGFKYLVDAHISFACNDNFHLVGAAKLTCNDMGKWDHNLPKCIPSKNSTDGLCKEPTKPENGSLYYIYKNKNSMKTDRFLPGTIVQYQCSNLYVLSGSITDQRICLETGNWGGQDYTCDINCGKVHISPHQKSLVINAEISKHGAWPWQIALEVNFKKLNMPNELMNPDGTYTKIPLFDGWGISCGGTLISRRWVLTAAHCLKNTTTGEVHPKETVRLYAGKHYRANARDDPSIVQSRMAKTIYIHEKYYSANYQADIALILLEAPFEINERVLPACLPTSPSNWKIETGVIAGWGLTEENKPSEELRQAFMKWAKPEECEKRCLKTTKTYLHEIKGGMFCAIPPESYDGQVSHGDSGSPLVFPDGSGKDLHWVVQGIVSWGYTGCSASASVFTEVRNYIDWINYYVPLKLTNCKRPQFT